MNSFADVIRALHELKARETIQDYAIVGAMALVFWTEPIATYDVDVLVWLSTSDTSILTLEPIYEWASTHGYPVQAEHISIGGVPVQILPAHNELADESIRTAVTLDYQGVPVRVVRPEYLIALYLEPSAKTPKRKERAAALMESSSVDQGLLSDILSRYNLSL